MMGMRRVHLVVASLAFVLFLMILAPHIVLVADTNGSYGPVMMAVTEPKNRNAIVSGTPHGPFAIDGDDAFATMASAEGWGGDGTSEYPFIIQNLDINRGSDAVPCISISNTRVHFIVRNCLLTGDWAPNSFGVLLHNVMNAVIFKNTISYNDRGIRMKGNSENNVLANNTCRENLEGIHLLWSTHNLIANNTFYRSGGGGIHLASGAHSNTVVNNAVEMTGGWGIRLTGVSDCLIANNTCSSCHTSGIDLDEAHSNTVVGNVINVGLFYGIYTYRANDNLISENTGVNCYDAGVWLYGQNNLVKGNSFTQGGSGIYLDRGSNTVTDNTCNNNDYGIYGAGPGSWTVVNNTCNANRWDGIFLYSVDSNNVVNNTCNNNQLNGIHIRLCNSNTFTNNSCNSNGDYGIYIDTSFSQPSDSNEILWNVFEDNSLANGADSGTHNVFDYNYWSDYSGIDADSDGIGDTPYSLVTNIDHHPRMSPCVAVDDVYAADVNSLLIIPAPGILHNDYDHVEDSPVVHLVTETSHGSLTLYPDGGFEYLPDLDWSGTDSFTYHSFDGIFYTVAATVTIEVQHAPLAVSDFYTTEEDTTLVVPSESFASILDNDDDADGDSLAAVLDTGPTLGTLTLSADGSFTYVPNPNLHGTDTFTYHVTDGLLDSDVATVTIIVNSVNDAPVAVDDYVTTDEDTRVIFDIQANDYEADGDPTIYIGVNWGWIHGDVTWAQTYVAPGVYHWVITYTPDPNWYGSVTSLRYVLYDPFMAKSEAAYIYITVNPVNDAPVAVDDAYETDEDTELTVAVVDGVLTNDTDVEGDPLVVSLISGPSYGTLTLSTDGSFTYLPAADFNGDDSFAYGVSDGVLIDTATVTIIVNSVNDAPVAVDDYVTTDEDTRVIFDIQANDYEADGDPTIYIGVNWGWIHGDVTWAQTYVAPGVYHWVITYTPDPNWYGSVTSLRYVLYDPFMAKSEAAYIYITVNPVNDAPVAVDDAYETDEDTELTVAAPGVLANDADVDGDALQAVLVTGTSFGSLTLSPDGSFTYTPNLDYIGTDSFTYSVDDMNGAQDTATVTISVLDKTPPSTEIAFDRPPDRNDWYSSDVTVMLSPTDAGSGVAETWFSLDGVNWLPYTGPFDISTEGVNTVDCYSTDLAGNIESTQTSEDIKIDKTPPRITLTPDRQPDFNGWYTSDVTVTVNVTDRISGIDDLLYLAYAPHGSWSSPVYHYIEIGETFENTINILAEVVEGEICVEVHTWDTAGIWNADAITLYIDKTAPETSIAFDRPPDSGNWYVSDVRVTLGRTDAVSGIESTLYSLDGVTWTPYTGTFTVSTEGENIVRYYSTDKAGNIESTQASEDIKIDKTPPTITLTPDRPPDFNGWYASDVTVTVNVTDRISGIGDLLYLAYAPHGSWSSPVYHYPDYDYPEIGETFENTINIPAEVVEGEICVEVHTWDTAGIWNADAITLYIDKTAPETSIVFDRPPDSGNWYVSDVVLTLAPYDEISGVAKTEYSFDGVNWILYSGPFTVSADGENTVYYGSTDHAGNVESKSQVVKIDDDITPPELAIVYSGGASDGDSGAWTVSVTDPESGIADIHVIVDGAPFGESAGEYPVPNSLGPHTIEVVAANADLDWGPLDQESSAAEDTVTITDDDTSGPVVTIASPFPLDPLVPFEEVYGNWPNPTTRTITIPDIPYDSCIMEITGHCTPRDWAGIRAIMFRLDGVGGWIGTYRVGPGQVDGNVIPRGRTMTFTYDMSHVMIADTSPDGYYFHNFIPQSSSDTLGFFSSGVHTIESWVSSQESGPPGSWVTIKLYFSWVGTDANPGFWTVLCEDPESGIESITVEIDGEEVGESSGNYPVPNGLGPHTIVVTARNADLDRGLIDQEMTTESAMMTVLDDDTTEPVISINHIGDAPTVYQNPGFWTVTVNDPESGIASIDVLIDGVSAGTSAGDYAVPSTVGDHTITVTAFNADLDRGSIDQEWSAASDTVTVTDLTPPVTKLLVGIPIVDPYLTSATSLELSPDDDPGIGVDYTLYKINDGMWITYEGPFFVTGEDGDYTVYYYAVDLYGNIESENSMTFTLDNAAPVTTLLVGMPAVGDFVTSDTPLDLSADDDTGVDVASIHYKVNDGSWQVYESSFYLVGDDGEYVVYYYAVDYLGNTETELSTPLLLDNSPPTTTIHVGTPEYNSYVTSETHLRLDAVDTGSDVHETYYRINSGPWTLYGSEFTLVGPDGTYLVEYYSVDMLGNTESDHDSSYELDNTAPESYISLVGDLGNDNWYVSSVFVTLTFGDGDGSGVASVYYNLDLGGETLYTSTFEESGNGEHVIEFWAVDNLGNIELPHNPDSFKIDTEDPVTSSFLQPVSPDGTNGWYVTPVELSLTHFDATSGVFETFYRVNGGPDVLYTGAVLFSTDGTYSAEYWSVDVAGNVETEIPTYFQIDQTMPETTHEILPPFTESGDTFTYVSTTTDFVLYRSDNLAGVYKTEYRVDSGPWTTYNGPFNVLEIGEHTVYYRSTDMAGNVETEHSFDFVVNASELSYIGATSGVYSDPVLLEAMLIDVATELPIDGKTVEFWVGTQFGSAVTDEFGHASVTIILDQAAGTYEVSASFLGDVEYLASSDTDDFTIEKETAYVEYTGSSVVPTTVETITLRATVFDDVEGHWGDLTKIWVTFRIYSVTFEGLILEVTHGPYQVGVTDVDGVGIYEEEVPNLPEDSYVVTISFDSPPNSYYEGPSSDDAVITVYEPNGDFVTGGGWIWNSDGNKGNFGFNVKYKKNGLPKGQFIYVYREGDYKYIIKSTAWLGMAIVDTESYFESKCVVQQYDLETGELIWSEGNYRLYVEVQDEDKDGGVDIFRIRVRDKIGLVYHEAGFEPEGVLGGGNITIHVDKKK